MGTEEYINSVSSDSTTSVFNSICVTVNHNLWAKWKLWCICSYSSSCRCHGTWCGNTCWLSTASCTTAITCNFKCSNLYIFTFFLFSLVLSRFLWFLLLILLVLRRFGLLFCDFYWIIWFNNFWLFWCIC